MSQEAVTYSNYLKINELLSLQVEKSEDAEHDEMLFIIIHQVYELWFKQLLHELDYLADCLKQGKTAMVYSTLRRVLTILKTIVAQIDVLETMTPTQFNSFRSFLESASGFQSAQFRELEFLLGMKRANFLNHFSHDPGAQARLKQRYEERTIWDDFLVFLQRHGHHVPIEHVQRDVTQPIQPSTEIQEILIDVYRTDPTCERACELLLDFDEGLQEWRYRHVKMVERTIGTKTGTGGSAGAQYLRTTLNPVFPDLWAIRTEL